MCASARRKEGTVAENHHTSHARALLNHLRHAAKRGPGDPEHHDRSIGEPKERRLLLLAALLVLIISAVSLHVVGGVFLMKAGLGMFSFRNPIALVLIGLSLVVGVFKLKHIVGLLHWKRKAKGSTKKSSQ
jgi:hypothetical protein